MVEILFRKNNHKLGQVWIETVIYTLIALVMIGLVLGYARPKIQEMQDQATIKQSLDMIKQIDSTLLSMGSAGNQRILEMSIQKGEIRIDGVQEKIIFELESKSLYSEPGVEITDGSVKIITEKVADFNLVTLTLDYNKVYNLQNEENDDVKTLTAGSTAYKVTILNRGTDLNGRPTIDFSIS